MLSSAAASSSDALTALRVRGMLLAAPAMTAASFASVLVSVDTVRLFGEGRGLSFEEMRCE